MSIQQNPTCSLYTPCRNNQYRCDATAGFPSKADACNAYKMNPQSYQYSVCGQSCGSCDDTQTAVCDAPEVKGKTPGWGSFGGREAIMNLSWGAATPAFTWKLVLTILLFLYFLVIHIGWLILIVKSVIHAPGFRKLYAFFLAPFYVINNTTFTI
jgi:hypothetical protein